MSPESSGKGSKSWKSGGAADTPDQAKVAAAMESFRELVAKDPNALTAVIEALKGIAAETAAAHSGPKRAICLAGGGPAVGLHIGALDALKARGVDFGNARSIWALSCIGAWVGVIYNQADNKKEIETTYNFFHDVFRDDKSFQSFPTNTIFAPDWGGFAQAAWEFLLEPEHYRNAFLPRHIMESYRKTLSILRDRENWGKFSEADFNRWTLNNVMAVHPMVRFLTALMYKSHVDGRSRLYYEDSKFLNDIKFERLNERGKPFLFHNAFNFAKKGIDLFANNPPGWARQDYKKISAASLCACSALPFIEQTVQVDGETYCEGALVDTVNFKSLLEDHNHPDDPIEEIWINRIVDVRQIRKPRNMHDSLANLCQMFAATVGEDDIRLFKFHVRRNNWLANNRPENNHLEKNLKWTGTLVEIRVDDHNDFHWSHENLDHGRANGARAAEDAYKLYERYKGIKAPDVTMIPDDLSDNDIRAAGVKPPPRR